MPRVWVLAAIVLITVIAGCIDSSRGLELETQKVSPSASAAPTSAETPTSSQPATSTSAPVTTTIQSSPTPSPTPTPTATASASPTATPDPTPTSTTSSPPPEEPSKPFEPTEPSGTCGQFGSFTPVIPTQADPDGLATGWDPLRLDVAVIADPTFVEAHPDDWRALLLDLVADASVRYEEQLGLVLHAAILDRLPPGSLAPGTGDGLQRATARGFMKANYPDATVDAVALIVGADYEGDVAGQVECVHGAAYPDYSYLWAEYDIPRDHGGPIMGIALVEDWPLKIFMHELAHLLAAHHHYSNCGEAVLHFSARNVFGVCDIMINDIAFASFHFGATNRLVMRSFVEEIGIGEPV